MRRFAFVSVLVLLFSTPAFSQWLGTNPVYYNAGSVGIGTSTPRTPLDIVSSRSDLPVFQSTSINGAWMTFSTGPGGGLGRGYFGAAHSAGGAVALFNGELPDAFCVRAEGTMHLGAGGPGGLAVTISSSAYVGIGTTNPTQRLDVAGNVNVTGSITAGSVIGAVYQDVAEWVPASGKLEPGTVVVLNTLANNEVMASSRAYDTRVAGVVSAQPGILLGRAGAGKAQIATTGRVKVKVDATNAAIEVGDLLVTGDTPGRAMKSEPVSVAGINLHRPGTLIGKALEPLREGQGEILILLSLQ